MAFTVLQAGTTLYGMDQRGKIVALTLPTGVQLDATLKARFTVSGNDVILVNSPSRPLAIDANLNVRVLTPDPPALAMTLTGVDAGGLSGTYSARQTYVVMDADGRLLSESDYGPTAATVTIAAKSLRAASINLSEDTITGRRLYRPTSGTAVYFQWVDLDGNEETTIQDDLSDAGLSTFSAPARGSAPDLRLIAEFKSRLYGVDKTAIDDVRYTEVGAPFAWPSDNVLTMPRLGSDAQGVTGLARRRDALGVGRSNGFYQITGTSDSDLRVTNLSENCGIEAPDSVAVYKDIAYFLWKDGVYKWDAMGIASLTDGRIRRWFTQGDTFNITRLPQAFGLIDPIRQKYRLYLASAGSVVENCWIEYDLNRKTWWGPHMSHSSKPSSAFLFSTSAGAYIPLVGGDDGYTRMDRKQRFDDLATAIDFDVVLARQTAGTPLLHKHFGMLSIDAKPQRRGSLVVQSVAGTVDVLRTAKATHETIVNMTGRASSHATHRIGDGQACKVRLRNNQIGADVNIRSIEIDPVFPTGRR